MNKLHKMLNKKCMLGNQRHLVEDNEITLFTACQARKTRGFLIKTLEISKL